LHSHRLELDSRQMCPPGFLSMSPNGPATQDLQPGAQRCQCLNGHETDSSAICEECSSTLDQTCSNIAEKTQQDQGIAQELEHSAKESTSKATVSAQLTKDSQIQFVEPAYIEHSSQQRGDQRVLQDVPTYNNDCSDFSIHHKAAAGNCGGCEWQSQIHLTKTVDGAARAASWQRSHCMHHNGAFLSWNDEKIGIPSTQQSSAAHIAPLRQDDPQQWGESQGMDGADGQTQFRQWMCKDSTCDSFEEIPGLQDTLQEVGLSSYSAFAEDWCCQMGAAFLSELAEELDDFFAALECSGKGSFSPTKRWRLQAALLAADEN